MGAVLICAVLAIAGIGATWYYMDSQLKAQQARAESLQNQIASGNSNVDAAYLELTAAGNFDFVDEIDANGGVAADNTPNDATPAPTLAIENMDAQDSATNVYITLYDPETETGGLPAALENTTLSIYVTWNGVLYPLYLSTEGVGAYTSGVNIGTIPVGGQISGITFSGIVDAAADDTYDDSGATYTLHVYIYQADAGDSTPVSYTLLT